MLANFGREKENVVIRHSVCSNLHDFPIHSQQFFLCLCDTV
jgi:hypothetical protein